MQYNHLQSHLVGPIMRHFHKNTHLDLQELGEAEDDGEEDGGRDVVHGPDHGGAVGSAADG